MKTKLLRIIGKWPEHVPEGRLIFNAPRPISGEQVWLGIFRHGIYYASVDPKGEFAQQQIKNNVELDAWVCEHVSDAEVESWWHEYAAENDIDMNDAFIKPEDIVNRFLTVCGLGEIELP